MKKLNRIIIIIFIHIGNIFLSQAQIVVTGVDGLASKGLFVGDTVSLSAIIEPNNATNKSLVWSSGNAAVATVDENGVVTALKTGRAWITAKTVDGNFQDKGLIVVNPSNTVIGKESFNKSGGSLNNTVSNYTYTGDNNIEWTLTGKVVPSNINKTVGLHTTTGEGFKSAVISGGISSFSVKAKNINGNNSKKLELYVNGVLKGSKNTTSKGVVYTFNVSNINVTGNVIIELKNASSANTVSIDDITWQPYQVVTGISLGLEGIALNVGSTKSLTTNVEPNNAPDKSIIWSSSNIEIATVDANGLITGIKKGRATITATTVDGNLTDTALVIVNPINTVIGTESLNNSVKSKPLYGYPNYNTYIGDNNIGWTLKGQIRPSDIDETVGIYMWSGKVGVKSAVISGGISSFSVKAKNIDGTNPKKLELYINGILKGSKITTSIGTEYTFSVNDMSIPGDIIIELKNASSTDEENKITIDDIVWQPYQAVTGVSLDAIALDEGATASLKANVMPINASNKSLLWSSTNTAIATVDQNGVVTGVTSGRAIIKVMTVEGGFTSAALTIVNPVNSVIGFESLDKSVKVSPLNNWADNITYVGDNDISWTLSGTASQSYINQSVGVQMKSGKVGLKSAVIPGGISSFSVKAKNIKGSNPRKLELYINNVLIGAKETTSENTEYTFNIKDINIEGDIVIAIKNASETDLDNIIAIDEIEWKPYSRTLSSNNNIFESVKIYPNPIKNIVNIKGIEGLESVEIYDLKGQRVFISKINMKKSYLYNLEPGIYFFKLNTKTASKTFKVIKQ